MQGIRDSIKRHGLAVLIIAFFVAIKVLYAQKFHTVIWDEAVYLGMGKWIYSLGQVGLFEMIRPIGLPMVLGLFWKLGLDYVYAAELLSIAFGAGVLVMTYLITKELTDRYAAAAATFILAVTPVFFLYTGYILTGIPSTFFTMLALYFFIKKRWARAGVAAAAASLTRFPQGMMFGGLFLSLGILWVWKRKPEWFAAAKQMTTAFIACHLPFLLFNYLMYREETSRLHHALFRPWILGSTHTQNLAESVTTTWSKYLYYPTELFGMNALIALALVGAIVLAFNYKKMLIHNVVAILLTTVLYFAFFGYIINKQHRFLLIFIPLVAVLCGVAVYWVANRVHEYLHKRAPKALLKHSKKIAITQVYLVLALLLFAYAYSAPMETNEGYYGWRLDQAPDIVSEYYQYLAANPPERAVITADPVPVAYTDARFIPIYFSIDAAELIYRESIDEASHLVYSNATFYCPEWHEDCKQRVKAFDEEVISTYSPSFEKQYGDRMYYIYKII